MKKKNKILFGILCIIIAIIGLVYIVLAFINDENKLTVEEKQWITNNISNIQNVYLLNDVSVVGDSGSGIFYDFIDDINKEYNITINPITYNNGGESGFRTFGIVNETTDKDLVFYEEHYVLVGKNYEQLEDTKDLKIGILSKEKDNITKYITNQEFITYDTSEALDAAFKTNEEIKYILVPQEENLSEILNNDYSIIKHYSDIKKYFVYTMEDNDIFSSIIKKYYSKWKTNIKSSANQELLNTLVESLDISQKELDAIQASVYNYGFVNNSPYEIISSGTYGGIVSEYIKDFADTTNTEFKFTKYKNYNAFVEAINNDEIDLFFNYYGLKTDYNKIDYGMNATLNIIAKSNNDVVINSIESLRNQTVYVLENSLIYNYLKDKDYINIETYQAEKELKKLFKDNNIIAIDSNVYNHFTTDQLKSYSIRYTQELSDTYNFNIKGNSVFNKLFSKFIMTKDPKKTLNSGMYNYEVTVRNGTILGKIASYSLYIILVIIIIIILAYKSTKKIKIIKKIKKEDRIRFIDQLTSLKNRNYLTENIESWNKNTIYPQAMIVIDLDNLQLINDKLGYEQGDTQIKAAANILIKTQLDNTDIIRTDGNEFLVYLVGYQEKQVVSYIRKLNKEFKNLPDKQHSATIGHSMITDNIKTIEDAINEAVDSMKEKKEETYED